MKERKKERKKKEKKKEKKKKEKRRRRRKSGRFISEVHLKRLEFGSSLTCFSLKVRVAFIISVYNLITKYCDF